MTNQDNDAVIAYFSVHSTNDNKGYMGGMMVIDRRGVPQEFHCTLPTSPTGAQKALYGDTLKPYLFNELIGAPLVKALKTPPHLCLVESEMMLELRERIAVPVLHLEKYGEGLSPDGGPAIQNHLESGRGGFQPITATTHYSYETDYESVREALEQVFNQVDLLEPFQRIATAIKVLSERDSRFK